VNTVQAVEKKMEERRSVWITLCQISVPDFMLYIMEEVRAKDFNSIENQLSPIMGPPRKREGRKRIKTS
jgi:hypothetical protein